MSINYYGLRHASIEDIYMNEFEISQENSYHAVFTTEANRGHFIANTIMYMISSNPGNIAVTPILYMGWGQGINNDAIHDIYNPSFSNNTPGFSNALSYYDLAAGHNTQPVPPNTLVELRNTYAAGNPAPNLLFLKVIVKGFYVFG